MTDDVQQLLDMVRRMMESSEFCFLITNGETGWPTARRMQPFGPEEDFTLWFGASPESRKVADIRRDDRVTVGYADDQEGAYVALLGTAEVRPDDALRRRYWRDSFADFWPDGPDGGDYVLIKVLPSRIELMNIARRVAPPPYGLRPAVLVRRGQAWEPD